jgi:hypothetical protein
MNCETKKSTLQGGNFNKNIRGDNAKLAYFIRG